MDTIKSIESQLETLNRDLPKLPRGFTKWLADYSWLLTLVIVILSIMTLVTLVPVLLVVLGISTAVGIGNMLAGYGFDPFVTPLAWLSVTLSFVNLLIAIVLESMAITPLKNKQHRGWQLLFITMLVSIAFSVVATIVTVQPGSLIFSLGIYAIGFYVLFQVRPHFLPHAKKADKSTKPKSRETKK